MCCPGLGLKCFLRQTAGKDHRLEGLGFGGGGDRARGLSVRGFIESKAE